MIGFGLHAVILCPCSGLRITHISEIREEVGACGIPSKLCAGLRTRSLSVPPREEPEVSEMLLDLFWRDRNNGHIQAAADGYGNIFQRHSLFRDRVIPGSRCALFERKSIESGSVDHMHGGPAIVSVANVG